MSTRYYCNFCGRDGSIYDCFGITDRIIATLGDYREWLDKMRDPGPPLGFGE